MSPLRNNDKLKEPKVTCTICSKELTRKYIKKPMEIHNDKDHLKAVAAKKVGEIMIKNLMSDIVKAAADVIDKDERHLIASAEDQEEKE